MSNFFKDIETDVGNVESELLGPSYAYYNKIASPSDLGMSAEGNLKTLENNVSGIINYVELLVSGTGAGSVTGKPLGDQFFLKTGAKCKDVKTGDIKTRYVYINNIPSGQIPFISNLMGEDFSSFRGLIPGVLQNMDNMNTFGIFKGFLEGNTPDCQEITMETTPTPANNNVSKQTEYVTVSDIQEIDPCEFTLNGKVNPVTNKSCKEAFTPMIKRDNWKKIQNNMEDLETNTDAIFKLYLMLVSLLGIYLLYKLIHNKNK
jgi:hypothetical protein